MSLLVPSEVSAPGAPVPAPADVPAPGGISRDAAHIELLERQLSELRVSDARHTALFLQEQKRARHLSLVNEVQKCALATRDNEAFLSQVTRAIGSHFADCDVTFYLSARALDGLISENKSSARLWDSEGDEMIVVAVAGEHGLSPFPLSRVSPDDLKRAPAHADARSVVVTHANVNGDNSGLLVVQTRDEGALEARDEVALMTSAAIITGHLQNTRLYRSMREIGDFNQSLLNSMLHSLLVVDRSGTIRFVNQRLLDTFKSERDDFQRQPLERVFGEGPARHHDLRSAVEAVIETGESREVPEVHVWSPGSTLIFDVRLFRVYFRGQAETALLLINLTKRWRQTYQLQMMHEIGRRFQEAVSLDVDKVLSTVLTCITAGSALGFNRAFVFLFDPARERLVGRMALGPSSPEEAGHIWSDISQREVSLEEMLAEDGAPERIEKPLQRQTRNLELHPKNPCFPLLTRAFEEKRALLTGRDDWFQCQPDAPQSQRDEADAFAALLCASEMVVAPLVTKEEIVGVIFADNLYSGTSIGDDDIQMLDTLAQQACLAIDNAQTYETLGHAQKELVSSERLVAVGEMAARVSHEIRNPLATIGGFARSVLKKPDEIEGVKRKTGVIVAEVARLEELLTDLLDMARPRPLQLQLESLGEIADHALLLAEADLRSARAVVERDYAPDVPLVMADRSRLLQALLNTIRNGAQAMPDGGLIRVSTRTLEPQEGEPDMVQVRVQDSGVGISGRALKQVFDPFFSTKVSGSGLGLAVTKRIIADHNGHINVESQEGLGTTFIFSLPVRPPAASVSNEAMAMVETSALENEAPDF
jgi:signal transduction histidine kinase/PAS domain-containing protein